MNTKNEEEYNFEKINILSNFASHAPDFEDFILFYIFFDMQKGFYIDVGANHPKIFSVTKSFYDRGWHGINIEPLPDKYKLLAKFRPRDINLNLGAGKFVGSANLKIIGTFGQRSTLFYERNVNSSELINIKIQTMSNICKKYVPKGIKIDFCKIDVEGSEKNVLLGYDFINYRPKVFCIESYKTKEKEFPYYKNWEYILISNDYNFAFEYGLNRFYYDKRRKGFKAKFQMIEYYLKLIKK